MSLLLSILFVSISAFAQNPNSKNFQAPIPEARPVNTESFDSACEMKNPENGRYEVMARGQVYSIVGSDHVGPHSEALRPLFAKVKLAEEIQSKTGCRAVEQVLDEAVSSAIKTVEANYQTTITLSKLNREGAFEMVASDRTDADVQRERNQRVEMMAPVEKLAVSCAPTRKMAEILNDIRLAVYGPELNFVARNSQDLPIRGFEDESLSIENSLLTHQLERAGDDVHEQGRAMMAMEYLKIDRNRAMAINLLSNPARTAVVVAPSRTEGVATELVKACRN